MDKIAQLIYEYLDYAYCDNCKYNDKEEIIKYKEIFRTECSPCEDCHRKMQNWGVRKSTCESLSEKIKEILKEEN